MPCTVVVLYSQGRLDVDYYNKSHMPLVAIEFKEFGLKSYRVVKLNGPADPNETAPYQLLGLMEFDRAEDFHAALAAKAPIVLGDLINFTDSKPVIMLGTEVAAAAVCV